MKKYFILFTLMIVFANIFVVSAANEELVLYDISEEEQYTFLSNIDFTLETNEPKKNYAYCFDVNPAGLLAVGMDRSDGQIVCVYDFYGNFKYAYSFVCSGYYYVKWDNENIIIYFDRSNILASFDKNGNCLYMKDIPYNENGYYLRNVFCVNKKTIDDNLYLMKNTSIVNFFSGSYAKIEEVGADGSIRTLYQVDKQNVISYITENILVLFFIAFSFFLCNNKKKNEKTKK